jgi:hypothetical protein
VQENSCVIHLGEKGPRGSPENPSAQGFWEPLESLAIEEHSKDGFVGPSFLELLIVCEELVVQEIFCTRFRQDNAKSR